MKYPILNQKFDSLYLKQEVVQLIKIYAYRQFCHLNGSLFMPTAENLKSE